VGSRHITNTYIATYKHVPLITLDQCDSDRNDSWCVHIASGSMKRAALLLAFGKNPRYGWPHTELGNQISSGMLFTNTMSQVGRIYTLILRGVFLFTSLQDRIGLKVS
jgi:hypothetical protein